MNWKEFEKNLKNKVDGHASGIDSEAFWDKLQKKKQSRKWLWIWLPVILSCILGVIYLLSYEHTVNRSDQNQTAVSNNPNQANSKNITHSSLKNNIDPLSRNSINSSSQNASSEELIRSKTRPNILYDETKQSVKKKSGPSNEDSKFQSFRSDKDKNSGQSKGTLHTITMENSVRINLNKQQKTFEQTATTINGSDDRSSKNVAFKDTSTVENLFYLPSIVCSPDMTNINLESEFVNSLSIPFDPESRNKMNPPRNAHRLSAYTAIGYYQSELSSSDSISKGQITRRNNTETHQDFYQAGLRFKFEKGFLRHFSIGTQYSQYNSRFDWERKWSTKDTLDFPVPNFYFNGLIDTTYNSNVIHTFYHRKVRNYNYYRAFQIPIYYSPIIFKLKNITFEPSVGLITGIWHASQGKILGEDDLIRDLKKEPVSKSGLLFSGEVMVSSNYNLSASASIFLELFYNRNFSNVLVSDYKIRQNIQTYGVRLGYSIKF